MVSEPLLQELHQIIKEDCGKDLSRSELAEVADTLVGYFSLLLEIDTRDKLKKQKYDNHNKPREQ